MLHTTPSYRMEALRSSMERLSSGENVRRRRDGQVVSAPWVPPHPDETRRAGLAPVKCPPSAPCSAHTAAGQSLGLGGLEPLAQHQDILIDEDTAITTVETWVAYPFCDVDRSKLAGMLEQSRPENWEQNNDFFVASQPGFWSTAEGRFQAEQDAVKHWETSQGAELLEHTQWHWNPTRTADAYVILTITDLRCRAEETNPLLFYKYHLHHCVQVDVGPTSYGNMLERDEGYFKLALQTEKDRGEVLKIEAVKRVLYANPDRQAAALLNLLAPALIGALMHSLVVDGTRRMLSSAPPS